MAYLLDTSILVRLANKHEPMHAVAVSIIVTLHRRTERLCITPQNLIEFRNVATRPIEQNGGGLSVGEAQAHSDGFEATFELLPDVPEIFTTWKRLVQDLGVIGKQVHDARLVAVCHAHSIDHLLTFNASHFNRLATFPPGIASVDAATFPLPPPSGSN